MREHHGVSAAGSDPSSPPGEGSALPWIDRAANWIVPEENPSGAIYGLLAIGSLLAAEGGRRLTYPDTVLSAALAACVYWLLHAYSSVLGRRLAGAGRLTAKTLRRELAHDRALLGGAAIPITALLLGWAAGLRLGSSVLIALWSAVAGLVVLELLAGIRSRASPRELALETSVGLTLGLAILGLRVLLH